MPKMLAARLYGAGDVRLDEVERPVPGPGEALVRITAALTCGTDLKMYRRGQHPALGPLPSRFGHELAGEIVEVGAGVDRFRAGMPIVAANSAPCDHCFYCRRGRYSLCESLLFLFGAFAEYVVIPARIVERNLYVRSPGLDPARAALIEPLACAVHGVEEAGIQIGDTVAVNGGGAIGLMLVRLASLKGARVVLFDSHDDRLALGQTFGADVTINIRNVANQVEVARELTDGRGVDVAIEAVGTVDAWQKTIAMTRQGGTAVLFGGCPANTTVEVDTGRVHYGELRLKGVFHHTPRYVESALNLVATGKVDAGALISGRFPLARLMDALDLMGERKGMKYAIEPSAL